MSHDATDALCLIVGLALIVLAAWMLCIIGGCTHRPPLEPHTNVHEVQPTPAPSMRGIGTDLKRMIECEGRHPPLDCPKNE